MHNENGSVGVLEVWREPKENSAETTLLKRLDTDFGPNWTSFRVWIISFIGTEKYYQNLNLLIEIYYKVHVRILLINIFQAI